MTAVLSTRGLEIDRGKVADQLEAVRRGQPMSGAMLVELLERYIELIELAKEEVRQRRELQAKFNRVVSCR